MTDTSHTPVRVRFAPSPTGYLHVGGARTALFNWLFARKNHGTMILRIEDTDAERNKPELVNGIIDGLKWLGIDWDEGPFYQSQRTQLYRDAAKKLLANGSAFLCYCPPERYAGGDHAEEGAEKSQVRRVVRCSCRDGKPSSPGTKPAIRFKVPTGGTTKFSDAVFGESEFSNDEIEDFVLLRSGKDGEDFGQAMYQMSVVVDDIDMRITHVIRGADHISNTPKQVLLVSRDRRRAPCLRACASDSRRRQKAPLQAPWRHRRQHVPPRRFSARSVSQFPRAARLGARRRRRISPHKRSAREVFSRRRQPHQRRLRSRQARMVQHAVSAEACRSRTCFRKCEQQLEAGGLWKEEWAAGAGHAWFRETVDLLRPRVRLLPDFSHLVPRFFQR